MLREIGPFSGLQIVPPRPLDGMETAGEVQTNVPLGGIVAPLQHHGGPVMSAPKLVALYCGPFWADQAKNNAFLRDLAGCGYEAAASFQGVHPGQFLGGFDLPAPDKQQLFDSDVQAYLRAQLAANAALPRPDANTLYFVILPAGTTVTFDGSTERSCTNFCGYHSSTASGSSAANILYAVHFPTDCAGCNLGDAFAAFTAVESHEYIEAATDPLGNGWFNDQSGAENADECAWALFPWGPWTVQGYAALVNGQWVNAVGTYQQPQPPPPPPSGDGLVGPMAGFFRWARQTAVWEQDNGVGDYRQTIEAWIAFAKQHGYGLI